MTTNALPIRRNVRVMIPGVRRGWALSRRVLLTVLWGAAIILSTGADHLHTTLTADHTDCVVCETSSAKGAAYATLTHTSWSDGHAVVATSSPTSFALTHYPSSSPRAPPKTLPLS